MSNMSELSKSQKRYVEERVNARSAITGENIRLAYVECGDDEPEDNALIMEIIMRQQAFYVKAYKHWIGRAYRYKVKGQSELEKEMLLKADMSEYARKYSADTLVRQIVPSKNVIVPNPKKKKQEKNVGWVFCQKGIPSEFKDRT